MEQMTLAQETFRRRGNDTSKTAQRWAVASQAEDVSGNISLDSVRPPAADSIAGLSAWGESSLRAFDIVTSATALLVVLPLMLLLALLIRLTSRGPAVYRQQRVGRHHKVFTLYKFRTMVDGAERDTGPVWASPQDCRVTPLGRVLRTTRLDELPQLLNVLLGDMSLVGPRPERPCFVTQYEALQGVRLAVRPGITGLAQTRGDYDLTPDRKLRYDVLYIRNRSLFLNVSILLRTIPVVLRRRGW